MEHAHKEETRGAKVRKSYEKLESRKGGLSERENSYKFRHLRFEEAFELNNLDLFFIIGCCNSLWVDIYIYIYMYSKIQRAVLFNKLSILQDTHIIKSIILRKYEQCFPNRAAPSPVPTKRLHVHAEHKC